MTSRRQFLALAAGLPAIGVLARPALAASPEIFNTDGIAVHGYDVVGYFTDGKAVDGNDAYMTKWRGAMWRFASAENLESFEMNPRAYAPAYGGYCAYAMAKGYVATSVPEAWTIYENRLYLNFSKGVRRRWRKDIPGYVAAADANWPAALQG